MDLVLPFKPTTNVIGPVSSPNKGWDWFWKRPLAYYPLLGPSGRATSQQPRRIDDHSGNRQHLTLSAGFPSNIWFPGKFGPTLEFSTSEQLTATAGQSFRNLFSGLASATFVILIKKVDATPVASTYLTQVGGASDTHYPYSDGLGYFAVFRSSRVNSVTLSSNVARNQWHVLTITTSPNAYRVWQNDNLVVDTSGESSVTVSGSGTIYVLGFSPIYNFDGRIGAAYFMGNAVTSEQVKRIVDDPWGGFRKPVTRVFMSVAAAPPPTSFSTKLLLMGVGK